VLYSSRLDEDGLDDDMGMGRGRYGPSAPACVSASHYWKGGS
jgi:hypothetical protein